MAGNAFTFGQSAGNNPFGAQNNQNQNQPAQGGGLFGGGAATGGGGMFGQNNNNAGGSMFGNPQPQQAQPSLFGQPQQQQQQPQASGGLFGQPAAGAGTGGFGTGGGMFGQAQNNTNANPFGGGAQRPGFGASGGGLFGGGATNTTQNAFGSTTNTGFGAPATNTGGFGTGSTSGLFGAKPAGTVGFGAAQPASGGLFGAKPAASLGTNTFGSNNNLAGLGGNNAQGVPPAGSAAEQYAPPKEKEGAGQNVSICNYHSISTMPTYRNCSFEELRMVDYTAGRKTAAPAMGDFGAPATNTGFGGVFGQQQQQQQTNAFGQAQPAAGGFSFGQTQQPAATGGGLFGNTGAAPATNVFGQQPAAPAPSLFGQQPAQPATNVFGQPQQPAQTNVFGQAQPAAGGNLFGNAGQAQNQLATGSGVFGSGFGATPPPAKPTGFGFGAAPAAAQPSPFGAAAPAAQSTGGLFGSAKPAFGQPAAATPAAAPFSGFGAPATGGTSLFGAQNATQQPASNPFGAAPASTNLFGSTNPQPAATTGFSFNGANNAATAQPASNLFGGAGAAPAAGTSNLFGSGFGTNQPAGQTGSLFGSTNKPSPFGQQPANPAGQSNLFGLNNSTPAPNANPFGMASQGNVFGQNQGQTGNNFNSLNASGPQGLTNSLLGSYGPSGQNGAGFQRTPISIHDPDPYGSATLFANSAPFPMLNVTIPLPPLSISLRKPGVPTINLKRSQLRQNIPPSSINQTFVLGQSRNGLNSPGMGLFDSPVNHGLPSTVFSPRQSVKKLVINKPVTSKQLATSVNRVQLANSRFAAAERDAESAAGDDQSDTDERSAAAQARSRIGKPDINFSELQQGDYWTWPKLNDLSNMGVKELSRVSGFVVGRQGYGRVSFTQPVDLSTVDELKSIPGTLVTFSPMSCEVYPESETALEPGSGMNQAAQIELENVWQKGKATQELIKDPANPAADRFLRKLRQTKDTKFISYDIHTGTWVFSVEHFTRYGVDEDDIEEDLDAGEAIAHNGTGDEKLDSADWDFDEEAVRDHTDSESLSEMAYDPESSEESSASNATATPTATRPAPTAKPPGKTKRGADELEADFGNAEVDQPETFDSAVERSTFGVQQRSQEQVDTFAAARRAVVPTRKYVRVALKDSVVFGREGNCKDTLAALGRSSRASFSSASMVCPSHISVSKYDIGCSDISPALELIALQRKHRRVELQDGVPQISTADSLRFSDFAATFVSRKDNAAKLWRLGHALFDELELPEPPSGLTDLGVETLARKAAFSRWLEDSVGPEVDKAADKLEAEPRKVYQQLSGHRIEEAVATALQSGDMRLALLVAQIGGGDQYRTSMAEQLAGWRDQGVDQHMSPDVKRVYALLAGIVDVLPGSSNSRNAGNTDVSVSEGLDWQRVLGLQLWYGSPFDASLEEVVQAFRERLPDIPKSGQPSIASSTGSDRKDALYALLEVFCNPNESLIGLLDPRTIGHSVDEVSTQWHLFMLLTSVFKIGLKGSEGIAARLTVGYAAQLESAGCWIEAIFVALHLLPQHARIKAVKEVLFRQPANAFAAKGVTERLVEDLKIPANWLAEAEANILRASGQVYSEFRACLSAGLFNRAHELLIRDLVPELVMHRDGEKAKELLDSLRDERVARWDVGGQIISDYIESHEQVPRLLRGGPNDDYEIEDLREYHQKLLRVNEALPGIFLCSKESPMNLYQKAALRQMMGDVQSMLAGVTRELGIAAAPVSDLLPQAERLRLVVDASRHNFLKKLEVACR